MTHGMVIIPFGTNYKPTCLCGFVGRTVTHPNDAADDWKHHMDVKS